MKKRDLMLPIMVFFTALSLPLVFGCDQSIQGDTTAAITETASSTATGAATTVSTVPVTTISAVPANIPAVTAATIASAAGSASAAGLDPSDSEVQLREKLAAAPVIAGTDKTVVERDGLRRVVYLALHDNPYGLAAGALAGEYKHEVYCGARRSGGIALAAAVAERFLQDALAGIPPQRVRWLLPLPVDLTDCRSLRPIRIELSARPLSDSPYCVCIIPDQERLGIVNMLDARQKVAVGDFFVFNLRYVVSRRSEQSKGVVPGEEMAFLFMLATFETAPAADDRTTFCDRLGSTVDPVLAGLTSVRGPFREHTFDDVLTIGGCPVFLMANRKEDRVG